MDKQEIERLIEFVREDSTLVHTKCADGTMPFRQWGDGHEETVVLIHGGSGSWSHWIRNIETLSTEFNVLVPDLPGLGQAAPLPDGYTAGDAAHWVGAGICEILGDTRYHLAAFSWGCVVASLVAHAQDSQLKSLMLIGPAALGEMPRRSQMEPLIKRTKEMSEQQVFDANRENLARLMLYDRDKIDDVAVYLQTWNTNHARFNSPQFALTTLVLDGLRDTTAPLCVIYGEFDAPAFPNFTEREKRLREVRADLQFELVPGAGHWLQYERADFFNHRYMDWVITHS